MTKTLRCFYETPGEPEAIVAQFKTLFTDVTFNISSKFGDYIIKISSPIEQAVDACFCELCNRIGKRVYSVENMNLPAMVVALLQLNQVTVSLAESFTGGLVCSNIVSVEGASKVFKEGYVTYSDYSKAKVLMVEPTLLERCGAVSSDVASKMAQGLLNITSADYTIATTGYASAVDGNADAQGHAFVAIATVERTDVFEYHFSGDRDNVRKLGANAVLYQLYKRIKWPYDFANIYINKN